MIFVERANLAGLVDDDAGRRRWLGDAFDLFTEMSATGRAERVEKLLRELK